MKKGISKILVICLTVVVMLGLAVGGWYYLDKQQKSDRKSLDSQISDLTKQLSDLKKTAAATSTATTSTGTATTTTTPTVDPYLYTNSTYGFTLTFNSKWQGYGIKPATNTGSTATYYMCLPTSDSDYTNASITSLAGTASLFAVSVYTQAQWTAATAEEGPQPSKIGDSGNWVVAYSPAQAYPSTAVFTAAASDVHNIMATFKAI